MTGKRGRRGREKRRAREGCAVTRPVPLDNCDTTIRLNRWLKKHGFRNTSRLRPADFPGTGRGLMACKSISSGQVLVSLPRELMITTQTVLDSYLGPHVSSWHPRLAPVDVLSVFLVCERCCGDRSPWQPYVDSLPERFTTPAYFTRRELRELPRSLDDAVRRQRTAIAASYNDVKKFMDELEKSFPEFRGTMTQDAHCWAWHIVNTRSVYMGIF
ncbi:PREDICTED: SET domain-containing protein 4-like [Priapulus caudatus]|uniref:SET domain-containing protein 4-like n=1 Tax=Priapulus caudatus TaxID=37621 RepID=A0ABM1E4Q8_PRICU|nr:PREDICTED: SET domain-containing protein 4-like [Priapulus caudatus]